MLHVSLHGGHVTLWRNELGEEILFTSRKVVQYCNIRLVVVQFQGRSANNTKEKFSAPG
ncbi:Glycoside hydrolase-type carbohydrate-binding, subgroup [Corchorus olitorius]|uniref:Glycoside hydrolase-type carbohydrate-binding, subgroup n=1 Tax=Corchorus olitorius TaxID=93759 RepID=A0A1R3L498_9ROSI|nr:Glycoside hydrolase-type carbohydrate-binding, subgroup [Corchorus olitorius]